MLHTHTTHTHTTHTHHTHYTQGVPIIITLCTLYFCSMDLSEPLSPIKPESSLQAQLAVGVHPARSLSTDHTHGLLAVPTAYGFSTSPKTGAFEYESINKTSLRAGSSDSIHSTASQ